MKLRKVVISLQMRTICFYQLQVKFFIIQQKLLVVFNLMLMERD